MYQGTSITLREWAINGKLQYTFPEQMECLEMDGPLTRIEGVYQQVSIKPKDTNCRWSYLFENMEQTHKFTLEFIVMPKADKIPEGKGQIVELDTLDNSVVNGVSLDASAFVTVRMMET